MDLYSVNWRYDLNDQQLGIRKHYSLSYTLTLMYSGKNIGQTRIERLSSRNTGDEEFDSKQQL